MDSVNSSGTASMQSSSGGDEESYDSRAAFLNNQPPPSTSTSTSICNSFTTTTHPFPPRHNNNTPHMFDPFSTPPTPFPNLDVMWSIPAARSEPNQTDLVGSFMSCSSSSLQQNQMNIQLQGQTHNNVVRNPKKRSRASRRAPTTVLTTDTTNFRAMVQEFTGIPSPPPFTSSSFPPRTRFDLFAPPLPPYLLRPFPRQFHPFPTPSTSIVDTLLASSNYNFNMHKHNNPAFNFQTILQPQPPQKYPLGGISLEIQPRADSLHRMGVFEELGGLRNDQNVVLSPSVGVGALSSANSTGWAQAQAQAQRIGTITNNNDCDHHGGGGGALNGTVNYVYTDVANGKVHYSASSSDFHGEKGDECSTVATRTEGNVDSWIN